jgi:hypothetical protein
MPSRRMNVLTHSEYRLALATRYLDEGHSKWPLCAVAASARHLVEIGFATGADSALVRGADFADAHAPLAAQIIFSRSGWCASLLCGLGNSRLAATHMREFAVLVADLICCRAVRVVCHFTVSAPDPRGAGLAGVDRHWHKKTVASTILLDNLVQIHKNVQMSKTDEIKALLLADPNVRFSKIAADLGVSRQLVSLVAKNIGLRPPSLFMSYRSEYNCWYNMIRRCADANAKDYGARGISVCARWMNSFPNFLSDMGSKPTDDHSIDRIDNDGNYEPKNCRWATWSEQMLNQRKSRSKRAHINIARHPVATKNRGKPRSFGPEQAQEVREKLAAGAGVRELADHYKVSHTTIMRYGKTP